MLLSADQHARLNHAIGEAEKRTTGEIFCVVTTEADRYPEVPLVFGVLLALFAPAAMLALGLGLSGGLDWEAAHVSAARSSAAWQASLLVAAQIVLFVVGWLFASIPPVRRALTPKAMKRDRVRRRAMEQFLAKGLQRTKARTGILIFLSVKDRMAELLADEGIASRVPPEAWRDAMNQLVAGMRRRQLDVALEAAIAACGDILASQFPPDPDDENELPNVVLELPRG